MTEPFVPSPQQKLIIEAGLVGQRVIACAGSGKTATAVRRLAEIRRQLGASRQYVALLSYSNVAVETFRAEYATLTAGQHGLSNRVLICTVDAFVTSHILSPHAASTMECDQRPYLVNGHEPFLKGFTFFNGKFNEDIRFLSAVLSGSSWNFFNTAMRGNSVPVNDSTARAAIGKLGKAGAYTHDLGRYWAIKTLANQPRLLKILAQRYPYILIDEAQDIGSVHGYLLELLIAEGVTVSLVGDPNQAIYEFAHADGSFLRNFDPGVTGQKETLSENRRSIQSLVDVTNKLSGTTYFSARPASNRKSGPYLIIYKDEELFKIRSAFAEVLANHGYTHDSAAVLCRARDTVSLIAGSGYSWGQGATEYFARAAFSRDRHGDMADAFTHAVDGVFRLLDRPPSTLRAAVLGGTDDLLAKTMRRIIWAFLRMPATGIPSASLNAKRDWLPKLKANLTPLLAKVETKCSLPCVAKWGYRVTSKELIEEPLWSQDLATSTVPLPPVRTVHQAKGQSIDAVLYLLRSTDVPKLLAGPVHEDGRIGYVGLTRARDLLVIALPNTTKAASIKRFRDAGFGDWS
ncbi:UvrD-helicase domain-containing protein [Achromobacter xylosoxidans]|uniref:UvrD-helicase domain-containing protein n=1 Tax=Alcaligenes xylosoxydans xylosoxydans TaxID=85698 RepID=UPI001EE9D30F|nr:ATP-dependent helicase [Achromobacter xylosoxidans]